MVLIFPTIRQTLINLPFSVNLSVSPIENIHFFVCKVIVIIIVRLDLEEIELKFTNDVLFNFENKCIKV